MKSFPFCKHSQTQMSFQNTLSIENFTLSKTIFQTQFNNVNFDKDILISIKHHNCHHPYKL